MTNKKLFWGRIKMSVVETTLYISGSDDRQNNLFAGNGCYFTTFLPLMMNRPFWALLTR